MHTLFLILLITLQPQVEILHRGGERTILRISHIDTDTTSFGGLIAYSYRVPEVDIVYPELDGGKENFIEFGSPGKMRDFYVLPFSVKQFKGEYVFL